MIHESDTAEQAIEKTIKQLCKDANRLPNGSEAFMQTVEAIAKLRASLNPTIIQKPE
jgi:hypothetical protein